MADTQTLHTGMAGDKAPLLEVEGLKTYFRTNRGILKAVDGISFTIDAGKTLGIVGESGSGKSVTVRSIMNLLPPAVTINAGGSVLHKGQSIRSLGKAQAKHFWGVEMAMVFQDPMTSLNPVMRIGRQISAGLRFHLGLSRREARQRSLELLDVVGVPEAERRLDEYPHQLSGGMRQRVTIAIALACQPGLLIADEPTTALDVTVQKQILDLLGHLQEEQGMGMILITHDLGVVAGRTEEVAVMYAGRIVEFADTQTLFADMRHPYTEALFESIPKIEHPSHTRLRAIAGRPPDLVDTPGHCAFAARCRYAQPRCLEEAPQLRHSDDPGHSFACYFPVGTPEGEEALAVNIARGATSAGLLLGDHDAKVAG